MKIRIAFGLALALLGIWGELGASTPKATELVDKQIRVGVYQNSPKIFIDDRGNPSGFWVQILRTIAKQEHWTIAYVPCQWQVCLDMLRTGQLDAMPDVAKTPERERWFSFNQQVVLSSWSEIYTNPNAIVNSVLDLHNKRIGVLKGSVQDSMLTQTQSFGVTVQLMEFPDFEAALQATHTGAVDVAVVNNFFGLQNARQYKLKRTYLLFNPTQLHFAVPLGDPKNLLPALDRHVQELTADKHSIYYQALDRWLTAPPPSLGEQLEDLALPMLSSSAVVGVIIFALWNRALQREVRQRKIIEAQLRRSEQLYASLAAAVPVGIFRTDAQGQDIYANARYCEILGRSADECLGDGWIEGLHPDDRERVLAAWQRTLEDDRPFREEYRFVSPQGKVIWVYGQSVSQKDDRGAVIGYVGSLTDISDRKQAERTLQERESFLRELTNNVPGAIIYYVLHPDGSEEVRYMNAGCVNLWEVEAELVEVSPTVLWQTIAPEDLPRIQASVMASAQHLTPWIEEWCITTAQTRQQKWVQARGNPQRLENGDVVWITVIFDTSDRKATELALVEAKEAAERASAAKSSFLANMSHEIRTPMNGVLGMLSLLDRTTLNSLQRSYLDMAQFSAESLLGLINDILDFSKIEAGKMELEEMEFNLRQDLEEFAQGIAFMVQRKGLEFILDVEKVPSAIVVGDRDRLRQILTNLVGNAIKFTTQGTIALEAALSFSTPSPPEDPPQEVDQQPDQEPDHEPDQWHLHLAVRDTGIGIPTSKLDRLFESFTQVDASTTRKYGGTGLGLAIVKQLCELMGGRVWAESVEGEGSCFQCQIPLGRSPLPALPLPHLPLGGMSILVVANHPDLLRVLSDVLEPWGATVIIDREATQIRRLCKKNALPSATEPSRKPSTENPEPAFDLAIVDQTTLQAINLAALQRRWPAFPLVILTTATDRLREDPPTPELRNEQGCRIDLLKPITSTTLAEAIVQIHPGIYPDQPFLSHQHAAESDQGYSWPPSVRLLLVEDSTINAAVIEGFLQELGLVAHWVDQGVKALQQLRDNIDNPYHLILLDCQMPEMDGYETSTRIRSGEGGEVHRSIPIIALTAYALSGDREHCLAAGMNDYLTKPLSLRALAQTLEQWLRSDRATLDPGDTTPLKPTVDLAVDLAVDPTIVPHHLPNDLPIFDQIGLFDRTAGKIDLAQKMCERFLEGIPPELAKLKALLDNPTQPLNFELLEQFGHRFKGSSSLVGAEQFRATAIQLETIARSKNEVDFPKIKILADTLEQNFLDFKTEIESWLVSG